MYIEEGGVLLMASHKSLALMITDKRLGWKFYKPDLRHYFVIGFDLKKVKIKTWGFVDHIAVLQDPEGASRAMSRIYTDWVTHGPEIEIVEEEE